MSALSEGSTPAHDGGPPSIDTQQLQPQLTNDIQQPQNGSATPSEGVRKPKAPSVRRACTACHAGKTRCSEVLPCQSCLKRGLGASCSYPDPEADNAQNQPPPTQVTFAPPPMPYPPPPPMHSLAHPPYYDYSNSFGNPSTSTFRPTKRPRQLTEEEAAAITRNFSRGDFFVGNSAPVRIDPRLPVRLTLAEGDQVHFSIGEAIV
ncbi:Zn(2)-C6 fungal-type domain-containing protein [Abortiporus biennis]